jgi:predicted extracellular nuclease
MQHRPYQLFLCLSLLIGIGSGLISLFIGPLALFAQNRSWIVPIYQLQGNGLVSPYAEKWVDSYGLVTGVLRDGFYLQDPVGDGDPTTSDGIFVYTYKRPTVNQGECVMVTRAYVTEFYEKTELSRLKSITPSDRCPSQTVQAASIPLPHL